MTTRPLLAYGLVPALITFPLTALRTWLEINDPDAPVMKFLSVFALGLVWLVVSAVLMLRGGAALKSYVGTAAIFSFAYRAAIGASYALAWTDKWRTPAGLPTRYETQIAEMTKGEMPVDAGFLRVFTFFTLVPAVVHVVIGIVAWFVAWAIAFRGKRPAVAKGEPISALGAT